MKKKVKFLYIDKHAITRNFFESCLKSSKDAANKSIELVTLDDFTTFAYNFEDFAPDLIFCDTDTFLTEDGPESSRDDFEKALEKEPEKFILCGKIEEIEQAKLEQVRQFQKPYSPHDLALQLKTFLPDQDDDIDREVH
jgi:hypothetical protein